MTQARKAAIVAGGLHDPGRGRVLLLDNEHPAIGGGHPLQPGAGLAVVLERNPVNDLQDTRAHGQRDHAGKAATDYCSSVAAPRTIGGGEPQRSAPGAA